jgi:hypothetical protein
MQPLFNSFQEVSFFAVLAFAILVLLYTCGRWILKDLANNEMQNSFSKDTKVKVDNYFTSKGYLVWDIKLEESTRKWKVSLVKNEKIIEAKGFSISEIEKYAESLI